MPAPKDLTKYPFEFYTLAEQAFRGVARPLVIGTDDEARKIAVQLRQRFNAFCALVRNQNLGSPEQPRPHPHKIYCENVSVSLRYEPAGWTLRFYRSGKDQISLLARQALVDEPNLPATGVPPAQPSADDQAAMEGRARQIMIDAGLIAPDTPEAEDARTPDQLITDLLKLKK